MNSLLQHQAKERLFLCVYVAGGELIYFEMDQIGQLLELAKRDMDGDVACLDIAPVLSGALRCK